MGMLASRGVLEPAKTVTAVMGCLMGAIASALLLVGGLSALQQGAVLASVPFTFVIVGSSGAWSRRCARSASRGRRPWCAAAAPRQPRAAPGRGAMRRSPIAPSGRRAGAGACGEEELDREGSAQPQGAALRITLGTQDFPEARILGELLGQALAVNGYTVDLRKRIVPTEDSTWPCSTAHRRPCRVYRNLALDRRGRGGLGAGPGRDFDQVKAFYAGRGMATSAMTPFQTSTRSPRPTRSRGKQAHDDRRSARARGFTLGARPEFEGLYLGLEGLEQVYGLTNAESSRSRSAPSTRRSTRATSTRPTSSRPTRSWRAETMPCSRIPIRCSGPRTRS